MNRLIKRLNTIPSLPLVAVLLDYLENVVVSIAMLTFPNV
jgi:hypothetical protein